MNKPEAVFFEKPILLLKLLHARHQRSVHAAGFGAPFVKCGAAHTVLAAELSHGHAVLDLLQNIQNLAVGITGLSHV